MSIVLMKVLESSATRYDKGIQKLTGGKLISLYEQLSAEIPHNAQVLDIGCGTGAFSIVAAQRECNVKGIDINPEMLSIAREKIKLLNLGSIEFVEMGVAELEIEPPNKYDAVISGLCFSELSGDEITYTLQQIYRILKSGGVFLLVDEAIPRGFFAKLLYWLVHIPLVIFTSVIYQTSTHPLRGIEKQITDQHFSIKSIMQNGSLLAIVATKGED